MSDPILYTDMIQLVLDIRRHTRMPGHEVGASYLGKSRMYWYGCSGCNAIGKDTSWIISQRSIHELLGQSGGGVASLIIQLMGNQSGRATLVEYLNNRIDFEPSRVVDRYHRPWVI